MVRSVFNAADIPTISAQITVNVPALELVWAMAIVFVGKDIVATIVVNVIKLFT